MQLNAHTCQLTVLLTLQIALVAVDESPSRPRAPIFSMATETVPVCAEAVIELETFATSFSPRGTNYNAAFSTAYSLFSDNHATGTLTAHY